jgi:hypothetical protein
MDLVIDQLRAEHKKASEDAAGSKVDDRAVLGNESTRGSDLVEMNEHDRIHVGKHDPPRAQVRQPRLEHVPGDMTGQFAIISYWRMLKRHKKS